MRRGGRIDQCKQAAHRIVQYGGQDRLR
jgi:hypothetical protein